MRTLKLSLFASAMLLGSFTMTAQTADEVMNKHITAVGGADSWKKITSMKVVGTADMQGNEVKITRTWIHNKAMRMDMDVMNMNNYMIVTNTAGWQYFPVMGQTAAEAMKPEEVKSAQEMLNVMDDVIKIKDAGDKVAYVGKEKIDGKDCHKLTVTDKDGDSSNLFFDATTGFLVKKTETAEMQGQKIEVSSTYGDYKKLPEGISVPMTLASSQEGEMKLSLVEVNKPTDESLFKPAN